MLDLRNAIASATLVAVLLGGGLLAEPTSAGCNQIQAVTSQTWRGLGESGIATAAAEIESRLLQRPRLPGR